MWLFTPFGFFSIVRREGDKVLTVRARARADLALLRKRYLPSLSPTTATPRADYPFRATVARRSLAVALGRLAIDIDYPNFKDQVRDELGEEREDLCHQVWDVMRAVSTLKPRARSRQHREST